MFIHTAYSCPQGSAAQKKAGAAVCAGAETEGKTEAEGAASLCPLGPGGETTSETAENTSGE